MEAKELGEMARVRVLAKSGAAKRIREAAGVSLTEVANVVGCSPSSVFRWEAAERTPKGNRALRYAGVLDELLKR